MQIQRFDNQNDRRRGFTLIEILVVLALVVVLASISWPALQGTFQRSELESAAKQVTNELSKVRLKAIETGVAQKFRFQPGKGSYEITPCPGGLLELHQELKDESDLLSDSSTSFEEDDSVSPYGEDLSSANSDEPLLARDKVEKVTLAELPVGIAFSGVKRRHHREEETEVTAEAEEVWMDDEGWSRPVIFFPNGQSTGGQIFLEQKPGLAIDLQLRGLTGEATVGHVKKLDPEEMSESELGDEESLLDEEPASPEADALLE